MIFVECGMSEKNRSQIKEDIEVARRKLAQLPTEWDGKKCVLELKEADYNWRQMEWWAWYFEWKCITLLPPDFTIPGDRIDKRVSIDAKRSINWDLKAKAIKSDDHKAILNDCRAIDLAIENDSAYGVIIALCDVEYNDENRSFQIWHTELKGGLSEYEKQRIKRTAVSRYRKTHATLTEIHFVVIDAETKYHLGEMKQGRNSNGKPRPPKYMIDLEKIDRFFSDTLEFDA